MGRDRGLEQLFLLPSIARWPKMALLAAFRRLRSGAQTWPQTPEIAKVAQRALQAFRSLVHLTEFSRVAYPNDIRQRFDVAQSLRLDPQTMTTRTVHGREMTSLADQPLVPAIEPARAIGRERSGGLAACSLSRQRTRPRALSSRTGPRSGAETAGISGSKPAYDDPACGAHRDFGRSGPGSIPGTACGRHTPQRHRYPARRRGICSARRFPS